MITIETSQPEICYISLGSNLNQPPQQLQRAIDQIKQLPHGQFIKASPIYLTKALTLNELHEKPQPDYYNSVVAIATLLTAEKLLENLLAIETSLGRIRDERRWQPRTIDLDLLLCGQRKIHSDFLTLPHPEMRKRLFVLQPLSDIAADLILPTGEKIADLVELNGDQQVERVTEVHSLHR